jgi:hypothetical protein
MTAINLTIASKSGGKLFRFDTAKAKHPAIINGMKADSMPDRLLAEQMQATVQALYDGAVSYDYAQSFIAEMHRRGLINGTDLKVVLP